ncbi:uncharacterized protein MEPE_01101 [Melanopsichium pennsylvanicum]|uniref:Thioredoxin domain-containing protein n=2 Tax=Melanopsichium pennsylvanicum TaxID=63383 RepID=A0AAJ5C3A2_9BASI|nr:thioredoxin-like protein [Melanopsichium pennsylvanicum 4]SNX82395.1 uncharacterized protein MEPE_01101 [Melanopsichium pennsylvanicum]
MSLLARWSCAVLTLLVAAASVLSGPLPNFDAAITSLTGGNFTSATETGMWFVEFYSPYCGHCKRFAPIFHDLAESNNHLQDSSEFHIARVNCIAQDDLCVRQNIDAYPSLELFRDGAWFESYTGMRTYDDLDAYVNARAADNRKLISVRQQFASR